LHIYLSVQSVSVIHSSVHSFVICKLCSYVLQGGMWIPGDFLVSPRKLTTVLAKEAKADGEMSCYGTLFI